MPINTNLPRVLAPSQRPVAGRRDLLPLPAPVPLSRLLPLDVLVQLRDEAARRVAAATSPPPRPLPRKPMASMRPALEEPSSVERAQRAPMLIGY
jgi:hypothetical protein